MKILTEDYKKKKFKIDKLIKITLIFEVGDCFINKENKIILLKSLKNNIITFLDENGKDFTDNNFLSEDWKKDYRFCGTNKDDFFNNFEDSMPLIN